MNGKPARSDEGAQQLALDVLVWLSGDEDRLLPFLQLTGLGPETLRASVRDPAFLGAVLDHVMGDEKGLLACAAALGVRPERIAAAWRRLQPPEFDHTQ